MGGLPTENSQKEQETSHPVAHGDAYFQGSAQPPTLHPVCHFNQQSLSLSHSHSKGSGCQQGAGECSERVHPGGCVLQAKLDTSHPDPFSRSPPLGSPAPFPHPPPPFPSTYLSWRGSQSTPGSSSRAAWRTSSLSIEKLRRWPACATATRIHSMRGGSTRKGLRRRREAGMY